MRVQKETRTVSSEFEVRAAASGGSVLVGYAAKFGTRSQDLGGFVETIALGAFDRALQEQHDVRALFNHDPSLILGRSGAGTLRLFTDDVGLRYEVDLPDTSAGRDLAESLRRGDVAESSFSFRVLDQDWSLDADGRDLRTITDLALYDVSPVTYPAYLDTSSALAARAAAAAAHQGEAIARALHIARIGAETDALHTTVLTTEEKVTNIVH
ncbi:HK97 family phage prohead protease [Streptomyces sp. NPDC050507]|uniref:HK97 family phage prohead protease n=1 Tax=Streptomyces sp. NPDC050507 TaxID=3365619 RepID=UPI003791CF3B